PLTPRKALPIAPRRDPSLHEQDRALTHDPHLVAGGAPPSASRADLVRPHQDEIHLAAEAGADNLASRLAHDPHPTGGHTGLHEPPRGRFKLAPGFLLQLPVESLEFPGRRALDTLHYV